MSEPIGQAVKTSKKAISSFLLGVLSLLFWILTGLPAVILGIWALLDIGKSQGRLRGKGFAIAGIALPFVTTFLIFPVLLALLLLPAIQAAREAARRNESANNMKMIGFALANFETMQEHFPVAGNDFQGRRPNLSWRVHILPFLEEQSLYEQFHLNEPWDSEHNKALIAQMPNVYKTSGADLEAGRTMYVVPTGNGAMFQGEADLRFSNLADGPSNTIMLLEADPEVARIWTQPDDWEFDPSNPQRGLGGHRYGNVFLALMADTSVHTFDLAQLSPEELSALFTREGKEVVSPR